MSNWESHSHGDQANFRNSWSPSFWFRELFDLSALSAKTRMAVLMLPSLGIIMLVGLFSRGMFWDGEWALAIDWVNGITIIMGPILSGLCAYEIQRIAGPDWRKLARQTQRPGALALRKMLVCWLWGCGVWAAAQITALVICTTQGTAGWFPWKALVFGPVALLFYVTYGGLVGTLLPRVIAGPIAAVSIFGIFYLGAGKFIPAVLTVGGFTASLVGQTWDPVFAALTILILSSGGIGLGVLTLFQIGERFRGWPIVIGSLLLTAIVGGVLLERTGHSRIVVTTGPVEVRCAGAIARTCLPVNDSTRLPELARLIDTNSKALIEVGTTPPKSFGIEIPGRKPPKGTAVISLAAGDLRGISADPGLAADFMATPTLCSAYANPNATLKELPDAVFQSRILLGAWLRKETKLEPVDVGLDPEALNKWLSSPEPQQNAWVRDTYAQLRNCELTKVSMPFKVGAF